MLSSFFFEKLGLRHINIDYSIIVTNTGLDGAVISIFIKNIKIMAPQASGMIDFVKLEFSSIFSIVDISLMSFYLGLTVEHNREN